MTTQVLYPAMRYDDAHAAGARIAIEPSDTEYGSREYSAYDCENYWWTFGTYHP